MDGTPVSDSCWHGNEKSRRSNHKQLKKCHLCDDGL